MFDTYKDLLDIADLQDALGIGRSMAYRLIREGHIRHLRIGKTIKVPKRYLVDFVQGACYNGGGSNEPAVKEEKQYDGIFSD